MDFKCHNDPRIEGEACGPGAQCGAGLKCLALVFRCIRTGSEEALADTLDEYKDDEVVKDTIGDKSGGEVDTMTASMKSSVSCSGTSEAAVQSCADVPANAAVNSIADSTNSTEKDTINSKMVEISQHFQQRLRYYQLKEYERLGIEPPAVLLDETNIVSLGLFLKHVLVHLLTKLVRMCITGVSWYYEDWLRWITLFCWR